MLRPKAAPRRRAHQLVLDTGNEYAYEFVKTRDPERLTEVRVVPGGRVTYTPCNTNGKPIGPARVGIFRAGGVRGQQLDSSTAPLLAAGLLGVPLLGVLLEALL